MNKTNLHQFKSNQYYYICETCGCNIFHINVENYCPRCGNKIDGIYYYYHSDWKDVKVKNDG